MDYGRWMRAVEAERVEAVERRRKAAFAAKRPVDDDDAARLVEHDRWLTAE